MCGAGIILLAILWFCETWTGQRVWTLQALPEQLVLLACGGLVLARKGMGAAYGGMATVYLGALGVFTAAAPLYAWGNTLVESVPGAIMLALSLGALAIGGLTLWGGGLSGTLSGSGRPVAVDAALLVPVVLVADAVAWIAADLATSWPLRHLIGPVVILVPAIAAAVCVWIARTGKSWGLVAAAGLMGVSLVAAGVNALTNQAQGFDESSLKLQLTIGACLWPGTAAVVLAWCAVCAGRSRAATGWSGEPQKKPVQAGYGTLPASNVDSPIPSQTGATLPSPAVTFWITFFFGLFGLIPAFSHSHRAEAVGQSGKPYWKAFWTATVIIWVLWIIFWIALYALFVGAAAGMGSSM